MTEQELISKVKILEEMQKDRLDKKTDATISQLPPMKSIGECIKEHKAELDEIFNRHMDSLDFWEIETADLKKLDELSLRHEGERHWDLGDGYDCQICKNKLGFYQHLDIEKAYKDVLRVAPENVHTTLAKSVTKTHTGLTGWTVCGCVQQRSVKKQNQQSNLGKLTDLKFSDYQVTEKYQQYIFDKASDYTKKGWQEGKWFLFSGQSGLGKTLICSIVTNYITANGYATKYLVYPDFMASYKDTPLDRQMALMDEYANVAVLYIDDLFKGQSSSYDMTILFRLINRRYATDKITIISTEMKTEQLLELNEAVSGRMIEKAGEYFVTVKYDKKKNYRTKDVEN
ncbi:MAG: DnaA/Hda family protein [Turicibacter sp.]|nr:DnaA/Hda family protein [Turicibacter sp.]